MESTIITTETEIKNYTQNIKCKTSNYESYIYDLCLKCNIDKGYFPAEYPDNSFLHGFTECYNSTTKPINFYFDDENKKYKPCYETCLTCNEGGNGERHNCLSCDANLREEPDRDSKNCITKCAYYYYYNTYGQYKCSNNSYCPDEANIYIKELKKCTNDCSKEKSEYKYQYGGQCLKECPSGTSNNTKGLCINDNFNSCSKSEREINLQEILTNGGIDINAKNYANEFNYTKRHVSYFYNSIYSIFLYKDSTCINELSLNIPKIDFGNCYAKVQQTLDPPSNDNIIIALIERAYDKKSLISYFFYHPVTGQKLEPETICKDEQITIKESVLSQLNNSGVDLNSAFFLVQQDINIFNLSDEFYTDICYNFVSPNGKDVPLNDRIKAFFPNITLCDSGCICKGVDLDTMESICECKFNDLMSNEYIEGNVLLSNTIGEVFDLIKSSNLLILKCYEGVFKKENIVKSYGGFIILGIIFFQLVFSLIFGFYDMNMVRKFLQHITEYFMVLVTNLNTLGNMTSNRSKGISKKNAPPKRRQEKEADKKIKNKNKRNNIKRHIYKSNSYKRKKKVKRSIFIDDYSKGLSSNSYKTDSKQLLSSKLSLNKNSKKLLKKQKSLQLYRKISDINSQKLLRAKTLCGNLDIEEYLKPDLDDLEYDDAIKFDKRTFCEFFIERLSEKQIIMNTFYYKENLKPKSIKIILFLLNIDLYFVINGFFYNEEYLSALFNSNKEETFFSYIARSFSNFVYATLVGVIIGTIIDCIFIEESRVKRTFLREKGNPVQLRYEISIITTKIKKRYIIFILLCFFISIISWYYVSCFNHVYPGVKIEWIKSSITIIIIMQIISILVVLLEGIVRDLSFHYQSEKLFKFKKFLS